MEAPEVVPQDERVDLRSTLQDRGFNGALMSILSDPRSSSQGSSQGLNGGAKLFLIFFFALGGIADGSTEGRVSRRTRGAAQQFTRQGFNGAWVLKNTSRTPRKSSWVFS